MKLHQKDAAIYKRTEQKKDEAAKEIKRCSCLCNTTMILKYKVKEVPIIDLKRK